MKMKKFRGGDVMMEKLDRHGELKAIVVYQQFDLGLKFKVYVRIDGQWRYAEAFDSMVKAGRYCDGYDK